jgi:hypothetical protein
MVMKSELEGLRCNAQTTKHERRKVAGQNVDDRALTVLKRECMGNKERVEVLSSYPVFTERRFRAIRVY